MNACDYHHSFVSSYSNLLCHQSIALTNLMSVLVDDIPLLLAPKKKKKKRKDRVVTFQS